LEKQGRVNRLGNEVNEIFIDEQEAEVVRRIFDLASHYGYGGRKIASVLAEEGIYNRNGEHFHYSTIQNILKNILYTGVLRSGESYSEPFPHLQIISPEQFEQVQEQLKGRRSKYEESRPTPMRRQGSNLLSGNILRLLRRAHVWHLSSENASSYKEWGPQHPCTGLQVL